MKVLDADFRVLADVDDAEALSYLVRDGLSPDLAAYVLWLSSQDASGRLRQTTVADALSPALPYALESRTIGTIALLRVSENAAIGFDLVTPETYWLPWEPRVHHWAMFYVFAEERADGRWEIVDERETGRQVTLPASATSAEIVRVLGHRRHFAAPSHDMQAIQVAEDRINIVDRSTGEPTLRLVRKAATPQHWNVFEVGGAVEAAQGGDIDDQHMTGTIVAQHMVGTIVVQPPFGRGDFVQPLIAHGYLMRDDVVLSRNRQRYYVIDAETGELVYVLQAASTHGHG